MKRSGCLYKKTPSIFAKNTGCYPRRPNVNPQDSKIWSIRIKHALYPTFAQCRRCHHLPSSHPVDVLIVDIALPLPEWHFEAIQQLSVSCPHTSFVFHRHEDDEKYFSPSKRVPRATRLKVPLLQNDRSYPRIVRGWITHESQHCLQGIGVTYQPLSAHCPFHPVNWNYSIAVRGFL